MAYLMLPIRLLLNEDKYCVVNYVTFALRRFIIIFFIQMNGYIQFLTVSE